MTMTRPQANLALLIAGLLWGAGNVAQKTVLADIGPFMAVGLRCAIAFSMVAPFALCHWRSIARIDRRGLALIAATSACFAVAVSVLQVGYGLTSVTHASFLVNATTVIVPFAAWAFLRTRPGLAVFAAGAITLTGVMLMGGGDLSSVALGDLLCLASALFFSLWMIALGEFTRIYRQACLVTAAQFAFTALLALPVGLAFEGLDGASFTSALPDLFMLGVVSTGLAYLIQGVAQKYTSAGEAAIITSSEALFGAAGGMVLMGDRLDAAGLMGASLVMLGIIAVQCQGLNWLSGSVSPARSGLAARTPA